MRLRVLGCSGGCAPGRAPSCYLLDGGVTVDAGALATALSVAEQRAISDVFLTHAHWDHVRDLPLSVINRDAKTPTLTVHGLPETTEAIHTHLMNDVVWFSAFELPSAMSPFIAANPMTPGDVREVKGYRVTGFLVPHTVPAMSYLFDDGTNSIVVCADTGGGGTFKDLPAHEGRLRAVFIEASFPNAMRDFAVMTGHLTPEMVGEEVAILDPGVEVFVTHMKPGFEDILEAELSDLGRPGLRPCRDGETLLWS